MCDILESFFVFRCNILGFFGWFFIFCGVDIMEKRRNLVGKMRMENKVLRYY